MEIVLFKTTLLVKYLRLIVNTKLLKVSISLNRAGRSFNRYYTNEKIQPYKTNIYFTVNVYLILQADYSNELTSNLRDWMN